MLFGFKTIEAGEQALIRNHLGKAKLVIGPARVTLWRSSAEKLLSYFADETQYLEVNFRNGPRECHIGPVQMFMNPVEVESINIKDVVLVSANEALVVYRNIGITKDVDTETNAEKFDRMVLHGPMRYVPKPGEWIHEFRWHGEEKSPRDGGTGKTKKVPGALRFKLLRTIADQFYYNVNEVRTKDDTMITVKLMIFFQLVNINKMLDNTHDPIADFINACCSDTIQYCSGLTYEEFVDNTSKMNDLETFKQLTSRAETIGYKVSKVVFRGFHSSEALQNMHDKAIHERTRLRLEADTENHRQDLLDLRLNKEEERSAKERELEMEKEEHQRQMEQARHQEQLRKAAAEEEHSQKLLDSKLMKEAERAVKQRELEKLQAEHERALEEENIKMNMRKEKQRLDLEKERLAHLSSMNADITKVMVAEARIPDKFIRIDNPSKTDVHLHDNDN